MKLSFHDDSPMSKPDGYWYASTDDDGFDADGPDPLTAVSRLVVAVEKELKEIGEQVDALERREEWLTKKMEELEDKVNTR